MCGIVMAAVIARDPRRARADRRAAYTSDLAVRELAVWLLLFVAALPGPGRAAGRRPPARCAASRTRTCRWALNFAAYWLIGFPAAWWFGIRQGFGPSGIWAGLIAGLVTCAVFLLLRYRQVTRVRGAAAA